MEQHPIPQNVSSYQFKLVGDMTLKQFFQLAGGFLFALIFYSTPLLPIIKWPFVIFSAILGIALAFLPLEERPLERWIFAFFKAIYAPTMFYWQKTTVPVKYFQDEPATDTSPQDAATKEYLAATGQKSAPLTKLEGAEKGFLAGLSNIFNGVVGQVTGTTPVAFNAAPAPINTQTPISNPEPITHNVEPKQEMQIPVTEAIRVVPAGVQHIVVEERKAPPSNFSQITTQQVAPIIAGDEIVSTKQALFSVDAAPPNPPTVPNVVVGQVVDGDRKIVEGAIMEIKDSGGRPVRALRSNKAGHFITVTPVEVGGYDIVTEKDGYEFVPVHFEATGVLIPPILVQGKKVAVVQIPATQSVTSQKPVAVFNSAPTQQVAQAM